MGRSRSRERDRDRDRRGKDKDKRSRSRDRRRRDDDEGGDKAERGGIKPGMMVQIHGLKAKPEFNGLEVKVLQWVEDKGAWEVKLESRDVSTTVKLKPDNLKVPSADRSPPRREESRRSAEGMSDVQRRNMIDQWNKEAEEKQAAEEASSKSAKQAAVAAAAAAMAAKFG
mmetsp:Transcript_90339/g.254996  ORF Transcript_90339/g.254996 Transcript_90339/m.254996 type:complete len:170 (-) Transcript_90339:89-598(-)